MNNTVSAYVPKVKEQQICNTNTIQYKSIFNKHSRSCDLTTSPFAASYGLGQLGEVINMYIHI